MQTDKSDTTLASHHGSSEQPLLSIVIPAFDEEKRMPSTLDRLVMFMGEQRYKTEIIVVDNASRDNTRQIILDYKSRHPHIHYYYEPAAGKGAAVRTGMLNSSGKYCVFCDADLAVPIEEISNFLPPKLDGFDIAIASREKKGANRFDEPSSRHLIGRIFNIIIQLGFLPGIQDSQCGFKCFTRSAALDLFSVNMLNGWCFDVEVLYIARLRGYKITEIPVNWYYGSESKVKPVRDFGKVLRELLDIRLNERQGRYEKTAPAKH